MLTTDFVPGTPNWLDLGARDPDAAVAFYSGLFGWTFQSAGPEAGGYGFFHLDGRRVAALGPLTDDDAKPSWTLYFHTADADATTRSVERAGGTVRLAPSDVFTAGRLAAFTDPTGAEFAVWQPRELKGLEKVMEPAALCWTELCTTDAIAARDFYASVFFWTAEVPRGGDGAYILVSSAGGGTPEDARHGGIMQLSQDAVDAGAVSEWHPYFGVTDCDAVVEAATSRGATVPFPPTDMSGVGRLAMLQDPEGALFAVIKGDPGMP